ncbi:MAG: hypothetical protein JW742_03865 [Candidatus Aminicenantes bacterium]|nr:hypothetical protein [Candidatus Aminicenantes bacterium]
MRRLPIGRGARIVAWLGTVAFLAAGCSSPESTVPTYETKTFTSTTVDGHSHTVTLSRSDIQALPEAGLTVTTSSVNNHTHTLSLTKAQCGSVNNSIQVVVETSTANNHSHSFSIANWWW